MKIKEICEKTGLTDRTVRYYIEEQLISPFYTENYLGRKSFDFSEQDLERLKHIAILRAYGFSVEEIKRLSLGEGDQIVEAVRSRTEETLDESQRRLAALSSLEPEDRTELSTLARRLACSVSKIEEEATGSYWKKRILSWLRVGGMFLGIWLPVCSAIAVLIWRFSTLSMPTVRPVFLVYTFLCLLPSTVTVLVLQKRNRSGKTLRLLLAALCVLSLPLSVLFSWQSVIVCDHHYEWYRTTQEATCEREGEVIEICQTCGVLRTKAVERLAHLPEAVGGSAPTCTEAGLSDGEICSRCHRILKEQLSLPATNVHIPVTDVEVPATCVKSGLSEGSHCSVCKTVLVEQRVIPVLEHSYQRRQIPQSCGVDGCTLYECACGDSYKTDIHPATNAHDFQRNDQVMGYTCLSCGLNVVAHGNADGTLAGGNNKVKYYVTGDPYFGKNYRIVVYGSGEMADFEREGAPWQDYLYEAVEITVGEGITSIGAYSFYCPEPRAVCDFVMSDTVKIIKSSAISLKLRSMILGEGVEEIGYNRFDTAHAIYIPKSVKKIDIEVLLSVDEWFYEGTLEEFFEIQTLSYGTYITMRECMEEWDESFRSGFYIYMEADDIWDKSKEWR